jgi:2-iminoacetate synthase ThiH
MNGNNTLEPRALILETALGVETLEDMLTQRLKEIQETEGKIISILAISPPGFDPERGRLMETVVVAVAQHHQTVNLSGW